ncbi:hypothetical protein RJ640_022510 [Escallonia rubra]|uniref:SHSP domain-containing protein n=1 Tax=Escallonia rubra TaxID=112253 RepID=A0AA88R1D2_9ASTE|nr:hypothetical protein RJ640_022510 [Escallonia rubra]
MAWLGPWHGGGRRGGGDLDIWYGSPFSSDLWDPFGGGRGGGGGQADDTAALAHANVDWRETDKAHIFRVDLPGATKEEVKVQVEDGNILQISGERTKEQEDKNDKWHRVERRRGSFVRRFRLPDNANMEEVKCRLVNGVLTVEVPKKETQEAQRNVRSIDVA